MSVEEVAQHFARTGDCEILSSGGTLPANCNEASFNQLIKYAFVPGPQSVWAQIREITLNETSYLLHKLGYRTTAGGKWEAPEALVAANLLEPQYDSLDSLCMALRCLDDLQIPLSAASRRRRHELKLTQTQLMALRLRLAVGFIKSEDKSNNEKDIERVISQKDNMNMATQPPVTITEK